MQTQSLPGPQDEAERIVAEIGIPPCPVVLATLVREARAEEPDFTHMGALILSDAGLAAILLKTANSALYSGAAPLTSIRQALMRVGTRNTVQLVTGLLLQQALPTNGSALMERWRDGSARIAALSARLAIEFGAVDAETAFAFGLFRDCGMALMLQRFEDYGRLLAAAAKLGRRLTDVETARYGVHHARIGFAMARSWLLHEQVCAAVLHHHSPDALRGRRTDLDPVSMRLIAIAALAEHAYARETGEAQAPEQRTASAFALAQLGVSEDDFQHIVRGEAAATPAG